MGTAVPGPSSNGCEMMLLAKVLFVHFTPQWVNLQLHNPVYNVPLPSILVTMPNIEQLKNFSKEELFDGLAETLGVSTFTHTETQLFELGRRRMEELKPLMATESEFDAYKLEFGMLKALLGQLTAEFAPPPGTSLH